MLKKTFRRFGALAMVLALAVSVFAVSAFAEEGEEPVTPSVVATKDVTITKVVSAEESVLTKAETYNFTIAAGTATTTDDGVEIYAGETKPLSKTSVDISLAQGVKTGTNTVTITAADFTKPGVYRYTVSETEGSTDGMTYAASKTMDVYVEQVNGVNSIAAVIVDGADKDNKEDLTFTNTYATNDLTVKKIIAGNQAYMSGKWEFTIDIYGQEGDVFATSDKNKTLAVVQQEDGTYKASATVELGNKETFTVYGLSGKDTYTVTETKANTDGYTTTIDDEASSNGVKSGDAKDGDVTVTYTNTKDVTTPTGVITTIAPYALMLVVAGAFAVVFLTRRNRAE